MEIYAKCMLKIVRTYHTINLYLFKASVLNLLRLADHLTNFVSVRGPPKKFPHFPGKISDDPLLSHFPPKFFSVGAPHKFRHFPGKNSDYLFLVIFPNSLNFSGTSTKRITISICSLVSDSHQNISKFPILVAARQADAVAHQWAAAPRLRTAALRTLPRQQKFRAMNGAHLASPIRGELGYAHWPQLGSQIHCPIGNQIWGPLGKDNVCPNFALTVAKFLFSNSGNFRAKANPP